MNFTAMEEILYLLTIALSIYCEGMLLWRTLEKGPHSPSSHRWIPNADKRSQHPHMFPFCSSESFILIYRLKLGVPSPRIKISFASVSFTGFYWAMKYQSEFAIFKLLGFLISESAVTITKGVATWGGASKTEARCVYAERGILPLRCCNINTSF